MRHDKFNATKLARAVIVSTTQIILSVKSTQLESVSHGLYIAGIRDLEVALIKDESVARSIASLVFSPDPASTTASLKKVRRDLNSFQSNGCVSTVRSLLAWKDASPFMNYAKNFILSFDLDYNSSDDLHVYIL